MSAKKLLGFFLASASLASTGCRNAPPVDLSLLENGTCATVERQKFESQNYRIAGNFRSGTPVGNYPLRHVPDNGIEYSGAANCLDPETIITPTPFNQIQP